MTDESLLRELLDRWRTARARGETVDAERICAERPDLVDAFKRLTETLTTDGTPVTHSHPPTGHDPATRSHHPTTPLPPGLGAYLEEPAGPDELGRIDGHRVLAVLGEGGMGIVLKAEHAVLKSLIAVKLMRPEVAARPEAKARFLREARSAASLSGDYVVPIHHIADQGPVPYIVMPLLSGETLAERLARASPLPVADVVQVGREIATGLAQAHQRGITHRDIKPSNIWLEDIGDGRFRAKILDFGLARQTDGGDQVTGSAGGMLGTPAYMAPEQIEGEALDGRNDLFSLGCVLYEAATGVSPFRRKTRMKELLAVTTEEPPPAHELRPELPLLLSTQIADMMAKKPELRPAFAEDVIDILNGDVSVVRPQSPSAVAGPAAPRRPRRGVWAFLAAVAILAALASLGREPIRDWLARREITAEVERIRRVDPTAQSLTSIDGLERFHRTMKNDRGQRDFGYPLSGAKPPPTRVALPSFQPVEVLARVSKVRAGRLVAITDEKVVVHDGSEDWQDNTLATSDVLAVMSSDGVFARQRGQNRFVVATTSYTFAAGQGKVLVRSVRPTPVEKLRPATIVYRDGGGLLPVNGLTYWSDSPSVLHLMLPTGSGPSEIPAAMIDYVFDPEGVHTFSAEKQAFEHWSNRQVRRFEDQLPNGRSREWFRELKSWQQGYSPGRGRLEGLAEYWSADWSWPAK